MSIIVVSLIILMFFASLKITKKQNQILDTKIISFLSFFFLTVLLNFAFKEKSNYTLVYLSIYLILSNLNFFLSKNIIPDIMIIIQEALSLIFTIIYILAYTTIYYKYHYLDKNLLILMIIIITIFNFIFISKIKQKENIDIVLYNIALSNLILFFLSVNFHFSSYIYLLFIYSINFLPYITSLIYKKNKYLQKILKFNFIISHSILTFIYILFIKDFKTEFIQTNIYFIFYNIAILLILYLINKKIKDTNIEIYKLSLYLNIAPLIFILFASSNKNILNSFIFFFLYSAIFIALILYKNKKKLTKDIYPYYIINFILMVLYISIGFIHLKKLPDNLDLLFTILVFLILSTILILLNKYDNLFTVIATILPFISLFDHNKNLIIINILLTFILYYIHFNIINKKYTATAILLNDIMQNLILTIYINIAKFNPTIIILIIITKLIFSHLIIKQFKQLSYIYSFNIIFLYNILLLSLYQKDITYSYFIILLTSIIISIYTTQDNKEHNFIIISFIITYFISILISVLKQDILLNLAQFSISIIYIILLKTTKREKLLILPIIAVFFYIIKLGFYVLSSSPLIFFLIVSITSLIIISVGIKYLTKKK